MPTTFSILRNEANMFDEVETTTKNPFSLPEDILVLSCTLYRLTKNEGKYRGSSLTNDHMEIIKHVTDEDRLLAEAIKIDFSKKLSYYALTVGKLSRFKSDLNDFLNSNFQQPDGTYTVPEKYVGMVYKLPYFYEYNMAQQALFDHINFSVNEKFDTASAETVTLKFIRTLNIFSKKTKGKIEYWFETENHTKVVLEIDKSNVLLPLFDKAVANPITVTGYFNKRVNYVNEYYISNKWKLSV